MRLFTAFPVSPEASLHLTDAQEHMRTENAGRMIRWVDPASFHVTVHFLGDVDTGQVDTVKSILSYVGERSAPFDVSLSRLDTFPHPSAPNTILCHVTDETGMGKSLEAAAGDRLHLHRLLKERRVWRPHITLGRVKDGKPVNGLPRIPISPLHWTVRELQLFSSDLSGSSPVYMLVQSFPLSYGTDDPRRAH